MIKSQATLVSIYDLRENKLLRKLSDDDLLTIIKTDSYNRLSHRFKPYLYSPNQLFTSKHSRALEWAISNSSTPLDGFFYLTCCVTLAGDIALGLITGVFGMTLAFGFYNYFSRNKQAAIERQKTIQYFQLERLRLTAANTYLARMCPGIEPLEATLLYPFEEPQIKRKPFHKRLFSSVMKGGGTSLTLVVGYYLASQWLLEAIGWATIAVAMQTPLGLGIAIGVAVLAGIYCGYSHYKTKQANMLIAEKKASMAKELQYKRDECLRISGYKQGLFTRHHFSSAVSYALDITPSIPQLHVS